MRGEKNNRVRNRILMIDLFPSLLIFVQQVLQRHGFDETDGFEASGDTRRKVLVKIKID